MLHLLLAVCWLILAALLLSWHWPSSASIRGTSIPLGWFGVAMALYNLLRWWLGRRSKKPAPSGLVDPRLGQHHANSREHTGTSLPPDPDFNFTNDPSPTP